MSSSLSLVLKSEDINHNLHMSCPSFPSLCNDTHEGDVIRVGRKLFMALCCFVACHLVIYFRHIPFNNLQVVGFVCLCGHKFG